MKRDEIESLAWPEAEGLFQEAESLFQTAGGLLPAVVQDAATGEVRMLGWMNREALAATLSSGRVTFFSRSRGALWVKGQTSGNRLELVDVAADCDGDALLVTARPDGATCHTGAESCFAGQRVAPPLLRLERTIAARLAANDEGSYTARLAREGVTRVAQKVGEEAVETALAAATGDDGALVTEAADLVYHLAVLLALRGRSLADVATELDRRAAEPA